MVAALIAADLASSDLALATPPEAEESDLFISRSGQPSQFCCTFPVWRSGVPWRAFTRPPRETRRSSGF